jgi:hypothetical protein
MPSLHLPARVKLVRRAEAPVQSRGDDMGLVRRAGQARWVMPPSRVRRALTSEVILLPKQARSRRAEVNRR